MLHKGQLLLRLSDLQTTPVQHMGSASPTEMHRLIPLHWQGAAIQAGSCFPHGAAVSRVRAAPRDSSPSPLCSAASQETCFCSLSGADLGSSPNFPNNRENRLVFLHLQTSMLTTRSPRSSCSHAGLWGRLHRVHSVKAP